jgi:hypothetical protein
VLATFPNQFFICAMMHPPNCRSVNRVSPSRRGARRADNQCPRAQYLSIRQFQFVLLESLVLPYPPPFGRRRASSAYSLFIIFRRRAADFARLYISTKRFTENLRAKFPSRESDARSKHLPVARSGNNPFESMAYSSNFNCFAASAIIFRPEKARKTRGIIDLRICSVTLP